MSGQRNRGAGNNNWYADVTSHGVKRYSNLLRHERPGNPISFELEMPAAEVAAVAAIGKSRHRTNPGRDNSVSPCRHNLSQAVWRQNRKSIITPVISDV